MRIAHPWKSAALATVLLTAAAAGPAAAHEGNPHYRSEVRAIAPAVDGVSVRVLDHDDALELTNRSGLSVTAYGYEHEPFVRVLADGTVQVNQHSPTYAEIEATEAAEAAEHAHGASGDDHADSTHDEAAGASGHDDHTHAEDAATGSDSSDASASAPADWVTLDKTSRYAWHDDRIKWRKTAVAPQVTDESKDTKIFDWQVPIRVGSQAATIHGTLSWVGEAGSSGGFPVAAVVSLVVLALLAVGAVVLVRRRRAAA